MNPGHRKSGTAMLMVRGSALFEAVRSDTVDTAYFSSAVNTPSQSRGGASSWKWAMRFW